MPGFPCGSHDELLIVLSAVGCGDDFPKDAFLALGWFLGRVLSSTESCRERDIFIDNLLVRIYYIIVILR